MSYRATMRSSTSARRSLKPSTRTILRKTLGSLQPTDCFITFSPKTLGVSPHLVICVLSERIEHCTIIILGQFLDTRSPCVNHFCVCLVDVVDLTTELVYLTPALREDSCVSHALSLRAAWALGNYNRFFKLYLCAPRMASYLIDKFLDRERKIALRAMLKT